MPATPLQRAALGRNRILNTSYHTPLAAHALPGGRSTITTASISRTRTTFPAASSLPSSRSSSFLGANASSFRDGGRRCFSATASAHARLIRRPKRPYAFTQLVQQTDGATYTHRTLSPLPLYRPTRDSRNNPIWQPSDTTLVNVEADEAGRLAAFRQRFGRGFDTAGGAAAAAAAAAAAPVQGDKDGKGKDSAAAAEQQQQQQVKEGAEEETGQDDDFGDLIAGYVKEEAAPKFVNIARQKPTKKKK